MDEKLEYILNLYPNAKCELEYTSIFSLLVAVVLSAQTTDKKVNVCTKELFIKYPEIKDLAYAKNEDVESILKYLGMYKTKAKHIIELAKIIHEKYNDNLPKEKENILALPGVGIKTYNVLLAEGYKIPALPVDTHVNRVSKRLKLAYKSDSVETVERKLKKKIPQELWIQMHHSMIFFGRYFCKAISPNCKECKLNGKCNKDNY